MGKNNGNSWLNAVRNAFKSPTKVEREENYQDEDKKRGKRRWMFQKNHPQETTIQHNAGKQAKIGTSAPDQQRRATAVAAAEAAVATARAAVDIIRLNTFSSTRFLNLHKAAVVIQTIFRGYLARRALMALKGIVKLQALIRAHIVRKRTKTTLQCIQSLVRVQAHVCDQRRRQSHEAMSLRSFLSPTNCRRNSFSKKTVNLGDYHPHAVKEIQVLVQKAKECSFKQGKKTLGHVLSQQIWTVDEDQFSDTNRKTRNDMNLHNLTIQSPRTPSSTKTEARSYQSAETPTSRSIYHHRMSMSESSCSLPRPNYMAATASAMARVRPHSMPRHRPASSPGRDHTAKKRLSFPAADPDQTNSRRYTKQPYDEKGLDVPCYLTE